MPLTGNLLIMDLIMYPFPTVNDIVNGALVVLYHKDLDSIKNTIIGAGGKISKDIFAFPGGRRFHFVDPSNNELAVWSDH